MHILIVEDDTQAASYLRKGLGESGHQADIAEDGAAGLELAQSGAYDVLVVDRMLPELDGLSLIGELRAREIMTPNAWEREGVTYRLKPLVYEPGIYGEHRYVLFTNGKIQRMDIESIYQIMNGKHK